MTYYVYSSFTNDMNYPTYAENTQGHNVNRIIHSVLINGGANRADKHFITPRGIMTVITEQDYEHLKNNSLFQHHVKSGYISVRTDKVDPEVAVANDMQQRDGSAPLTPESPEIGGAGVEQVKDKPNGPRNIAA